MSKPYRMKRLGILNQVGEIWTPSTFDTDAAAWDYMADYSRMFRPPLDLSRHTIVPVRVTVSVIKSKAPSINQQPDKEG